MLLYQILGIIVSILGLLFITIQVRKEKLSGKIYGLGLLILAFLLVFSSFPEFSMELSFFSGLDRGLDVLIIISIFGAYYLLFKLYNRYVDQKKRVNNLVSELAIMNEKHERD
ncbi:MAG: DUF2304 family protein [Methanobacteriaceae archaeon]|nr:DUF2304 family protein [Methanobacteriaceae archaeon]